MTHRRRLSFALLSIALAFGALAVAGPIDDIVAEVSQASYQNYLDNYLYTYAGSNRGFGAQHDLAQTNILNEFDARGLTAYLDPFTYNLNTYYNVIGAQLGTSRPTEILVLGAHYDSANNPGADDDASGVAGLLEAARALAGYAFERTIVFAAFDREEQGLVGSRAYASAHAGDTILGMAELDMIAYSGSTPNQARVYWADSNSSLTTELQDALLVYGGITAPIDRMGFSDHVAFDEQGFDAALIIEYTLNSNYYHTARDNVDEVNYIDYDYATRITRSAVGWLAETALLVEDSQAGVPEPATMVLLGVGLAAAARRRRISTRTRR